MKMKRGHINTGARLSSLLMLLTLAWLTISTPFVYEIRQDIAASRYLSSLDNLNTGDEQGNINNILPAEERTENSNNNFSEYLHHYDVEDDVMSLDKSFRISLNTTLYLAFHGEHLTPPPDTLG